MMIPVMTYHCQDSSELKYLDRMKATKNAEAAPPKKPSQDFLGETLSNNFVFPNFVPAKYAPESLAHKINKEPIMTS